MPSPAGTRSFGGVSPSPNNVRDGCAVAPQDVRRKGHGAVIHHGGEGQAVGFGDASAAPADRRGADKDHRAVRLGVVTAST